MTNHSGNQRACPLYLTICNIQKAICWTPTKHAWILIRLIPFPLKCAKNIDDTWHNMAGTVQAELRHLDITGPGLKWNCADGFEQQFYPLLASWVGDYLEHFMVAQVAYGSCLMCEIPKGARMGHSTCWPFNNSTDQHIYSELLEDNNIDAQHTLGVCPIHNQFWQYPLCNDYCLWQPDELYLLLLGLVQNLLHWLLKYLKARNVKDQFDNQFTMAPRYSGRQPSLNHSIN